MNPSYKFKAEIWRYNGKDPWYFVTLPTKYADEIKSLTTDLPNKGFGTVKVDATINNVSWSTSIFPDKKHNSYLMPVKKEIRSKLQVKSGDMVEVSIRLSQL